MSFLILYCFMLFAVYAKGVPSILSSGIEYSYRVYSSCKSSIGLKSSDCNAHLMFFRTLSVSFCNPVHNLDEYLGALFCCIIKFVRIKWQPDSVLLKYLLTILLSYCILYFYQLFYSNGRETSPHHNWVSIMFDNWYNTYCKHFFSTVENNQFWISLSS